MNGKSSVPFMTCISSVQEECTVCNPTKSPLLSWGMNYLAKLGGFHIFSLSYKPQDLVKSEVFYSSKVKEILINAL